MHAPSVKPNNLNEYLDGFRAAAQFLADAQADTDNAPEFYQLWCESLQYARARFHRGNLTAQFIADRERDVLVDLVILPETYLIGIREHALYELGKVHTALSKLAQEDRR